MLASNDPLTGKSSLAGYHAVKEAPQVADLVLSGLPASMDSRELKKISGAKHVISSEVEEDRLKGTCLGTGRIQMRLNQGESLDSVTLNFVKNGWTVEPFTKDNRKCPDLTGIPKEKAKPKMDAKTTKQ